MGLSAKEQERIIEEEKLRFKVRQDLHAQACAAHPRRGRWFWIAAVLVALLVLWRHCPYSGMCCHGMGRPGVACPYHGGMMAPPDGAATAPGDAPSAAPDKADKAKDQ
jgi:hypothetical protein